MAHWPIKVFEMRGIVTNPVNVFTLQVVTSPGHTQVESLAMASYVDHGIDKSVADPVLSISGLFVCICVPATVSAILGWALHGSIGFRVIVQGGGGGGLVSMCLPCSP